MSRMWDVRFFFFFPRAKNDSQVFDQSKLVNDYAIFLKCCMLGVQQIWWWGNHRFGFGHFKYESLLDSQVEMLGHGMQLDVKVWSSGHRSGRDIYMGLSLIHR